MLKYKYKLKSHRKILRHIIWDSSLYFISIRAKNICPLHMIGGLSGNPSATILIIKFQAKFKFFWCQNPQCEDLQIYLITVKWISTHLSTVHTPPC